MTRLLPIALLAAVALAACESPTVNSYVVCGDMLPPGYIAIKCDSRLSRLDGTECCEVVRDDTFDGPRRIVATNGPPPPCPASTLIWTGYAMTGGELETLVAEWREGGRECEGLALRYETCEAAGTVCGSCPKP